MTKKAVILLSGGLDSTTCLAIAKSRGFECYTLSVAYGQKHSVELSAAKRVADYFHVKKHDVITVSIGDFGGSALTDATMSVPDFGSHHDEIPTTYVPARNTIFLSIALGVAEIIAADAIFIGANAVDYSGYPDCRPLYFDAFQTMTNYATKAGVSGKHIKIETPILTLTKAEIITLGVSLGVDYSITLSCYKVTEDELSCGVCDSCVFRKKGFLEANIADPTKYRV
ncbi:MAG: 7-cyano-7-deazaguanine synthase QueC [Gammaproteobacteria bacterium RIFCSPHIGHO2_12_FULL_40_19]|nr:MAG: 7-cyano-7-deazaguanine synthase QueC [Gammaproteobacteria bacterium RIFCSPHIGHO2_12_FULL_40_19]